MGGAAPFRALADQVRALADGTVLKVAEFTATGIVSWEVSRDKAGTPRARSWPAVSWEELSDGGFPSERTLGRVLGRQDGMRLTLVCTEAGTPDAGLAFDLAKSMNPGVPAFAYRGSLGDLLLEVMAEAPITLWYELVTLWQPPWGNLSLTGIQLFPPGARRGDTKSFSVRCEPGGEHGTVFAVVAVESVNRVHLVSRASYRLPVGTHNLTAELLGPGRVRFHGLPDKPREDGRTWREIAASVPTALDLLQPVHLICAVEISGRPEQVGERLERLEQLIRTAAARSAQERLRVSLIGYGPHAIDRRSPEVPVTVLTWARSGSATLAELWKLDGRAAEPGYPRAAQLECVLAEIAGRLTGEEGRPVLVTAGSRPPFPPRVDLDTEIIPCSKKHDWRRSLDELCRFPGIAFGAISDQNPDDEPWRRLGRDAFAPINAFEAFGVRQFAARLGLVPPNMPFPLVEPSKGTDGPGSAAPQTEPDSTTRLVEELTGLGGPRAHAADQDYGASGATVPPDVPRYQVTIYVSGGRGRRRAEAAVIAMLAEAELRIMRRDNSMEDAGVGIMWAGAPDAHDDQEAMITQVLVRNIGPVISALAAAQEAVIQAGAVLVVKASAQTSLYLLTEAQQAIIRSRPQLAASPQEIVAALRLPSDGSV